VSKYYIRVLYLLLVVGNLFFLNPSFAETDGTATASEDNNSSQVLSTFIGNERGDLVESFDERREQHKILFYMGVVLLVFILLTAGFGISMAMLGKEVFVPHMICAGISVFLSIAHAVVAMVWFFPF